MLQDNKMDLAIIKECCVAGASEHRSFKMATFIGIISSDSMDQQCPDIKEFSRAWLRNSAHAHNVGLFSYLQR